MSERMTSITLPGLNSGHGIADWGRKTPEEMVERLRSYAERQKAAAERILAAAPSDFRVETYVGVHVQRQKEVLQEGLSRIPDIQIKGAA